ncbi:putative DNA binding domain-containing protein [Candidatus Dependentiae bacterium]|nr:putative DNA binding domain-containing protein [Candidatus Dependentiae bacterium]
MTYPDQESSTLEFKVTFPKNDQIIKTIIAFCNEKGGKLIVGVEDDGTIIGIQQEEAQQAMEYLEKSIYKASNPPIVPKVYAQAICGKIILIIEVSSGMNKPYYQKSEGLEKGVYVRLGRSTLRANADMIEELKWQSRGKSFDTLAVYHATMDDIDTQKIYEFFNLQNITSYEALLLSYHLKIEEHAHTYPTVTGILTFGKNPQHFLPQSFIICSHFEGISGRTSLATQDCTGTVIEQFYQAYNFILSRLNKSFTIKGPKRIEVLEIPQEALREVLVNALVHRNYHIQSPIKIALFDNRIEIFSPGTFPGPISINNLCAGLTYIRNNALAKILRRAGLIETLGTGFLTLFESYAHYALPIPQVIEGENYIKCILPRNNDNQILRHHSYLNKDNEIEKILHLFSTANDISMSDLLKNSNLSRSSLARRIKQLLQQGLIKQIGVGKGARYIKALD